MSQHPCWYMHFLKDLLESVEQHFIVSNQMNYYVFTDLLDEVTMDGDERDQFTYERRPESQAYIPFNEGDYYYGGAVIGGRPDKVLKLVKTCRMNLDVDRANKIEAVWQEESHLNKYFLYNKPTKVLSPEYLWDDRKGKPSFMKVVRFSQVEKNYAEIRPNP
ncbi:hypothetical protein KOW79_021675 [Hemibagrus wyckioides]|uniref:Uncharacterized protein n=1 Tax=Hemibagrus wyckioides TaxID=337641 RepID=A0A9D3N4Q5_9TELE|nr:hypothetical protein KOW79_021675 [Hemibagrus wyckioides]